MWKEGSYIEQNRIIYSMKHKPLAFYVGCYEGRVTLQHHQLHAIHSIQEQKWKNSSRWENQSARQNCLNQEYPVKLVNTCL